MLQKRVIFMISLLVSSALAAYALPPTLVLGGYTEGGASSTASVPGTPYSDVKLQGAFGWRQALAGGSYLAVASRTSIAPFLTTFSGFVDNEFLNLELGLPSAANMLIFAAGANSSAENLTGVGSYARPAWSAEYRFARSDRGLQLSVSYLGSYLAEGLGSDDHLSQGVQLMLDKSTNVRLETYSAIEGTWELWTKQPVSSGTGIATLRQDWLAGLSAGARGFAGYTVDWSLGASGGVRFSDANIHEPTGSLLVLPGGSRFTAKGEGSLDWTPSRYFEVALSANLENDWYFSRPGVNPDGTLSTATLDAFAVGGGLKADWTPNNVVYLVIKANADRTFANDPNVALCCGALSAGLEYSF